MTKEYACLCIISNHVAEQAGINVSLFPRYQLMVRNRKDPIVIRAISDIQILQKALAGN
jgi:hypothetical protein